MPEKKKYNDAAMHYAINYLERLLELEDYVENRVERKIDSIVQRKLAQQEHKHAQASDASQAQESSEIINQNQNKL
jgi:hypothetical protein